MVPGKARHLWTGSEYCVFRRTQCGISGTSDHYMTAFSRRNPRVASNSHQQQPPATATSNSHQQQAKRTSGKKYSPNSILPQRQRSSSSRYPGTPTRSQFAHLKGLATALLAN
ncbi:hypothetical protein E4U41_006087 [Claviceps citrina]|nr:hypothetical protein E4U41_006087 [Claviceps citrina]